MDEIEKVELEWQKIWLQILTGSFPPQGVNETVDEHILFIDEIEKETCNGLNLTPDFGDGLQMTHTCANNDLVEKRKHDGNVPEVHHIEANRDRLLKVPRLQNKFENLRPGINENKAQESRVSKICDFKLQAHENTGRSNYETGCEGKR
ncbi:hypothetical protein QAD02_007104 [Eretmocerus hayati]|uniref:Uncharacterized protein n=1 Tax=Eretmocerus hayati TaxID=131215 RepID=A0ACC2N561_9HYME|nr:hypothetical protein QAD02_007104 [Eretmocerus hayati]